MTGKPKFLKTWGERLGPYPRQLIDDIVHIYGPPDAQSKGGHAKAEKNATALKSRNQKIRAEFVEGMKVPGAKRKKVVASLGDKYHLSSDRINSILRQG
jgi:hypothetical protein